MVLQYVVLYNFDTLLHMPWINKAQMSLKYKQLIKSLSAFTSKKQDCYTKVFGTFFIPKVINACDIMR